MAVPVWMILLAVVLGVLWMADSYNTHEDAKQQREKRRKESENAWKRGL